MLGQHKQEADQLPRQGTGGQAEEEVRTCAKIMKKFQWNSCIHYCKSSDDLMGI